MHACVQCVPRSVQNYHGPLYTLKASIIVKSLSLIDMYSSDPPGVVCVEDTVGSPYGCLKRYYMVLIAFEICLFEGHLG